MTTWHQFLVESAKSPFPRLDESQSETLGTTRVSTIEEQRIEPSWKATHAVRDQNLVRKLCDTLEDILADDIFPESHRVPLIYSFAPWLSTKAPMTWWENASEAKVSLRTIQTNDSG
jgi:hypothetical protein